MSDVSTSILIAVSSAAGIYFIKKIVECIFPHHIKLKCYINPIDRNMPNMVLSEKYEEYNIDNNLDAKYIKYDKCYTNHQHKIMKISIPTSSKDNCHIFKTIYEKPETGYHFLRVKLKDVTPKHVYLFRKSYMTEGSNKHKGIENGWEYKEEALNGVNEMYVKSKIGEDNCDKEQIGLMVLGSKYNNENQLSDMENGFLNSDNITCTVEEACYHDKIVKICSLFTNYCSLFYKCYFNRENQNEN